jgi:hypothetical protein
MNELVMLDVLLALLVMTVLFVGAQLKAYLPAYTAEKGKNLATKEDVGAITRQVEGVKDAISLDAKRREIVAGVADFVILYKTVPVSPDAHTYEQLLKLEAEYYRLVMWLPTDVLSVMNKMLVETSPARPDAKDLILAARRAILGSEAGDFAIAEIAHMTRFK